MLLDHETSQLLIIDVQEKLAPAMHDGAAVVRQCEKVVAAASLLYVPVTVSEHVPQKMGATVESLRIATGVRSVRFPKTSFSCWRDEALRQRIEMLALEGRRQIILCGMESHVCVLQTAIDLNDAGFDVFILADAVASRAAHSKDIALQRMQTAGITMATFEMMAFEWLGDAGHEHFKPMFALIR